MLYPIDTSAKEITSSTGQLLFQLATFVITRRVESYMPVKNSLRLVDGALGKAPLL